MKSLRKTTVFGVLILSMALRAQGRPNLEIEIRESKVNMTADEAGGKAAVQYAPGDTILYTIYARNTGDAVMTNAIVVDPIPEGVEYVVDSATGKNCLIVFSVDDGKNYAVWPIMVTGSDANGTPVIRKATTEEVTHIKWQIQGKMAAGEQKELTFKVIVK